MAAFDPAEYENMALEGANETVFTPVPDGEYPAIIDQVKVDKIQRKDGTTAIVLNVTYDLFEAKDELKKLLNRDKVTMRSQIWLDLTDTGSIAFGPNQNVKLGQLRHELNMNDPKKPFFFKMMEGAGPVKIRVSSRPGEGDRVYNDANLILSKK